jgi:hypothetical protein
LNIFYDGDYSMNYYIWLIIKERRKQCVLPVIGHWFYRQQLPA